MNKVILKGRIGKDPEKKSSSVVFTLATTKKWTSKEGDKKEQTQWHNLVSFGKLSDIILMYVKKGSELIVEGSINYSEKDGKYYTSILVENIEFCGSVNSNNTNQQEKQQPVESYNPNELLEEDDDLPF